MAKRRVLHVTGTRGDWNVREENRGVLSHHRKKEAAVDAARREAKQADLGQVKVHKEGGQIQTEYTYGQDPKKYPG